MDWLGYKAFWGDSGRRPERRIEAKYGCYDLSMGLHPDFLPGGHPLFEVEPFNQGVGKPLVQDIWQSDPRGTIDGHNVIRDAGLLSLLDAEQEVPLSPLFVKDLAGRMVYIGGPERKDIMEWGSYNAAALNADGEPVNMFIPLVTFPRYCREVEGRMTGAELLERVFLLKFRNLDVGRAPRGRPSGAPETIGVRATYPLANLYPYKYRPDTFYVDGWKLPQTAMVFARQDGVREADARAKGDALLALWGKRTPGMTYTAWLEAQGDQQFLDDMFAVGCTVIPTFEAFNGVQVVGRDFRVEDFWPGRAISGLHEVIERRADKAPVNTILEVLEPGYVTMGTIRPAKVVVSDGSGYVSPNVADPLPLVPNLNLPHSRTLAEWQATWVPTHPEHFEIPALWGWDLETGRFLQLNGPIWDPLHYYYESNELIYKAIKEPMDENRWLVPVPEAMQERCYPVIPLKGFHVVSPEAYDRRKARQSPPQSMVTRVPSNAEFAGVGYHPLPPEFEYEIETFWFPELHPRNREHGLCAEELMTRLCPIITPSVSVQAYISGIPAKASEPWMAVDAEMLMEPTDEPLRNYTFLLRYTGLEMDPVEMLDSLPLPFLGHFEDNLDSLQAQEYWAGLDSLEDLESLAPGLYEAAWEVRERAMDWMRFRYLVYQTTPGFYKLGHWFGSTLPELQLTYTEWSMTEQKNMVDAFEASEPLGRDEALAAGLNEGPAEPVAQRPAPVKAPMQVASMPAVSGTLKDEK